MPNDNDWKALGEALGTNAGKKLKSTTGWADNGNGTNESGFNAFPAGELDDEYFHWHGFKAYWWSSTYVDATQATTYHVDVRDPGQEDVLAGLWIKKFQIAASVRCIKE